MTERTVLVAAVGKAPGSGAAAAALACAGSDSHRSGLLVDLAGVRAARPSLFASAAARQLEERLAGRLPEAAVASRGLICRVSLPADTSGLESVPAALPLAGDSVAVVHVPPRLVQPALAETGIRPAAAVLRADLARDRHLTALAVGDLTGRGIRVAVLKRPLGWLAARAALLGALPADSAALPRRLAERALG